MSELQDASRRGGRRKRPLSAGGEASDLAAVAHRRADAAAGGRALGRGPDDDHADLSRCAGGRDDGVASSRPGRGDRAVDGELLAARAEIARLEETVKEQAIELVALRGKTRSGW
jgi:hypothetical protein